ncbi:ATP synthase F0 subunit B [Desulfobacterales bacterium HSG16]|nr:ATP synthase F0 subunit B [Desulfobacterales bacterium HSG16]
MKGKLFTPIFIFRCCLIAGVLTFFAQTAWASEESGGWRQTYDGVMLWINFLILAALLFKYVRPLLNTFLQNQQEDVAGEIKELEIEKQKALAEVGNAKEALAQCDIRLEKIKDRIINEGEKKRQSIIEEAKEQSLAMMETSKKKIDNYIVQSKESFKMEMVDAAIEQAQKKLPELVTEEDNQRLLDRYLSESV